MTGKTKNSLIYIVLGLVVVALAAAAWFFKSEQAALPGQTAHPILEGPQLTEEIALEALRPELFVECLPVGVAETYRSCGVELFKEIGGPGWKVWVTYEGLYDDSIRASRLEAYVVNENGNWVVKDVVETNRCREGRGHQDFSAELCV